MIPVESESESESRICHDSTDIDYQLELGIISGVNISATLHWTYIGNERQQQQLV